MSHRMMLPSTNTDTLKSSDFAHIHSGDETRPIHLKNSYLLRETKQLNLWLLQNL